MSGRGRFTSAAAFVLCVCAGVPASERAARADARPSAPAVTWSSHVAGPRRDDLKKALTQPWKDPYDTRNFRTGEERRVATCAEAKALPKWFEPDTDQDLQALKTDLLRCRVMELLLDAKPASTNHLGGFALDEALLDQLPASLIPTPASEEARKLELAGSRGTSWRERDPKIHIVKQRPDTITIESPKTRAILSVLGRGDLNGDGVEDLVLERAGGGRKGTWTSTEAFIITRTSAGAPLEVVNRIR